MLFECNECGADDIIDITDIDTDYIEIFEIAELLKTKLNNLDAACKIDFFIENIDKISLENLESLIR